MLDFAKPGGLAGADFLEIILPKAETHNPNQSQKSLSGWSSNSSNLVIEFVESLVLEFVKSGARFRQIWCFLWWSLVVLDFVKSGARIRQIWC